MKIHDLKPAPGSTRARRRVGRGIGGFCPSLIGLLSTRFPLGDAIAGFTVAAYALVIVCAWAIPETRGRVLIADGTLKT